MSYVVYRGNRRYGNRTFNLYEQARNFVRKLVRSGKVNVEQAMSTVVDTKANSIPLSSVGFSVKRRSDKTGV